MDLSRSGHIGRVTGAMPSPRRIEEIVSEPNDARGLTFEQIYQQYFDFAWANLRRLGIPAAHLDDAVQELFIVVHRRLGEFAGRSTMKTWLAGIAWRIASEHRRHESRKGGTEPLPDTLVAPGQDPLGAAVHAEALRELDALLDQLDEDKRVVFVLAELEQMSVPEIAAALAVNVNTVYSRLRAARSTFDEALRLSKTGARGDDHD
jgi:RNA polymerase sigma-70 factor, ECF subfamily